MECVYRKETLHFNSKQPKQVGSKSAVAAFTPVLGASLSSGSDDRPNWRGANIAPSQMDFLDVGWARLGEGAMDPKWDVKWVHWILELHCNASKAVVL